MSYFQITTLSSDSDLNNLDATYYEYYCVDATNNDVNLTLVQIGGTDGMTYQLYRLDSSSNTVTLTPLSGSTINRETSISLAPGSGIQLVALGTNYIVNSFA